MRYIILFIFLVSCSKPAPGPDRQFEGIARGAVVGAGAGMVTGFQVGSSLGPAAAVGAGLGAIVGGFKGFADDQLEDQMQLIVRQTHQARARAYAQEVLAEHYKLRSEIHPARDIFPSDIFFRGDEVTLRPGAESILKEIAYLDKEYLPWSRLGVISYIRSDDRESEYANFLARKRSKAIVNKLIQFGLEPRRLIARGVVMPAPLVIDPDDHPDRYSQAIEFMALDK